MGSLKATMASRASAIDRIIHPEAEHIINNFYERRNATMADDGGHAPYERYARDQNYDRAWDIEYDSIDIVKVQFECQDLREAYRLNNRGKRIEDPGNFDLQCQKLSQP
ncbi:hypothetical protein P43SY_011201 [Pythium insidiosum]|uniref:Uncharacterized protein n=1 Tax=Pythium insidiosum TaxID=114742 RepID=A0AAD5LRR5_PYTIN|nr:hypothetical protein P43SY_011201 [Pythium insidiosum]